jgi:hypothetical protein
VYSNPHQRDIARSNHHLFDQRNRYKNPKHQRRLSANKHQHKHNQHSLCPRTTTRCPINRTLRSHNGYYPNRRQPHHSNFHQYNGPCNSSATATIRPTNSMQCKTVEITSLTYRGAQKRRLLIAAETIQNKTRLVFSPSTNTTGYGKRFICPYIGRFFPILPTTCRQSTW